MKRKIIALLLTLCMLASLIPTVALADEAPVVAKIGEAEYASVAAAIAEVPTDNTKTTIVLQQSFTETTALIISDKQNVVLDLGEYTLTLSGTSEALKTDGGLTFNPFRLVNKGTLTIQGTGTLTGNDLGASDSDNKTWTGLIFNQGELTLKEGLNVTARATNVINYGGTLNTAANITLSSPGYQTNLVETFGGSVNMTGGTLTNLIGTGGVGIAVFNKGYNASLDKADAANVIISGGAISASNIAVSTNNAASGVSNVTIKGNVNITSTRYGIFWPSAGKLTLGETGKTGPTVSSKWTAITVCDGTLEVNSGTYECTDTLATSAVPFSTSSYIAKYRTGSGIAVGLCDALTIVANRSTVAGSGYDNAALSVTINGGTFSSATNYAVRYMDCNTVSEVSLNHTPSLNITGGTFIGGYAHEKNGENTTQNSALDFTDVGGVTMGCITGGTFSSDPTAYIADGKIAETVTEGYEVVTLGASNAAASVTSSGKTTYYVTLQDAVSKTATGTTVKMLKSVTENVIVPEGQKITLDLNGFTLSGGTVANKAALTNYGTVTVKDSTTKQAGTICREDNGADGYYVINNQGTMTIESGNVYNMTNKDKGSSLIRNADIDVVATLNITGGNIKQDGFNTVKNGEYGILNITGGTITTAGDGEGKINSAVQNWCTATIGGNAVINGAVWTTVWSGCTADSTTTIEGNAKVTGRIVVEKYSEKNPATKTPYLNITGGTLDVEWVEGRVVAEYVSITGGVFSSDPSAYCVEGKTGVQNTDSATMVQYPFAVGEKGDTAAEVAAAAAPQAESTVKEGDGVTAEDVALAASLATVLTPAEGTSAAAITGSGIEAAAKNVANNDKTDKNAATETLKSQLLAILTASDGTTLDASVSSNESINAITADNITIAVQTYMDIKVTDAKDNTGEGGDGTKSITVDITPMIQTVATTADDTSKIVTEGAGVNAVVLGEAEHLEVTGTVEVAIPLPSGFVTFAQGAETATLYVRHTTESGRVYTYQGTVDAATHVLTFDNPHGFSSFEIGTQAAVATNGNIGYDNLKEAVEEAKDGDTITISADNTEKITVTKTISFTIAGGYTTKIKAGAYTTLTKTDVEVGTLYTFVYTAPTYSDKDDKDDADTTETPSFTDVPEGQWYSDAVAYCAANGLMDGVGDGKFEPRTTVSRAMAITTLYRMAGSPEVTGSNNFTDLTQDWYKDAVQWGVTVGITDGVSATSFAPDDDISREQLATMLYRYANVMGLDVSNKNDLSGYTDSGEISSFATEAMQWANAAGYVTGNSATTLAPKAVSDRATLATILMRYCESNAAE